MATVNTTPVDKVLEAISIYGENFMMVYEELREIDSDEGINSRKHVHRDHM